MDSNPWVGKSPWRRKLCFSILAWEILWTEEPGGLQSMGRGTANGRAQLTEHAHTHISLFLTHTHTLPLAPSGKPEYMHIYIYIYYFFSYIIEHYKSRTWQSSPHRPCSTSGSSQMGCAAVGSLKDSLMMAAPGTRLVLSKRERPHNPEASEERGNPGKSGLA